MAGGVQEAMGVLEEHGAGEPGAGVPTQGLE